MAFDIMQEPTTRRTGKQLSPDDTILGSSRTIPRSPGSAVCSCRGMTTCTTPACSCAPSAALLPYHSHVDPATMVSALNHMIDDANNGHTVFYDFYAENEKREQATKSNTGLFFFRGRPGAPFAMIAPGGGFSYVGSVHEGFPYAVTIASQGYNAFVLKYRAGAGGAVATQDLAAAVSYVFRTRTKPWRWLRGLLRVGQFGWRANGRRHRLARGGAIRRRRPSQAVSGGDGLHRPFGVFPQRTLRPLSSSVSAMASPRHL